jgi:hypothetical protein
MGLEVYYPQDIRNALLAAEQGANATAEATGSTSDPFTAGYMAGYRAALTTLALAFGLVKPPEPDTPMWLAVTLRRKEPCRKR